MIDLITAIFIWVPSLVIAYAIGYRKGVNDIVIPNKDHDIVDYYTRNE